MTGVPLQKIIEEMQLTNLTPEIPLEDVEIQSMEVNRPALQLTGFFDHFDPTRIQIMGKVEWAYIRYMVKMAANAQITSLIQF